MNKQDLQGIFKVIDSFAIKKRNEFYLIGELIEGNIKPNWFAGIHLNSSLNLTVKIKAVEDVDFTHEQNIYKLIIVDSDEELTDLLLGLNIGSETMNITLQSED